MRNYRYELRFRGIELNRSFTRQTLIGRARRKRLLIAAACFPLTLAVLAGGSANADVGDGGDPAAVNLRVSLPGHAELRPTISGSVRSFSEADGAQDSDYSGTARFGVDRSGPGLVLRSTVVTVNASGTSSSGNGPLKIKLSPRRARRFGGPLTTRTGRRWS